MLISNKLVFKALTAYYEETHGQFAVSKWVLQGSCCDLPPCPDSTFIPLLLYWLENE